MGTVQSEVISGLETKAVDAPRRGLIVDAIRWAGYPVILLSSMIAAYLIHRNGMSESLSAGIPVLVAGLLAFGLERVLPFTPTWRPSMKVMGLDLIHTIVAGQVIAPLVRGTGFALLASASIYAAEAVGMSLWPTELPLAVQVMLALVISDLGAYSVHRWMHLTRSGWRLHVVHHCPSKLHVLAAARTHPFNAVLTMFAETGPLILLGISPEALMLWTVYKGVNGLLQHTNIDLRPGVLSYVLATSDVHRWHHSVELEESNTNFGNTTMVWDHVFGTFFLPKKRPRTEVGVADAHIPDNYFMHLLAPFWLGRFEQAAKAMSDASSRAESVSEEGLCVGNELGGERSGFQPS